MWWVIKDTYVLDYLLGRIRDFLNIYYCSISTISTISTYGSGYVEWMWICRRPYGMEWKWMWIHMWIHMWISWHGSQPWWCPLRTCSYSESICRAKIESVEMYKGLWLWRSRDGLLFDFCARGRRVRIARKAEISRPQTPRIQHHNHRYEREQKWTVGKEQKDCYSISIPWSGLNLG